MASTLQDFVRVLGLVPTAEPITRPLRLLEAAEQRAWRVWATMEILAPTGTVTVADVARWEILRLNLYQAQLRVRSEILSAAGPLRPTLEDRIPPPRMLPAYAGPLLASSGDEIEQPPETIDFYGAILASAPAAAAPAAAPVALGASPLVWAGIALAALIVIGGTVYLIASSAEAAGATLMAYRQATHEERWWDERGRFVLECLRLYPQDEAARQRCIANTAPPRPAPPRNPFADPPAHAPGWVPWAVGGLAIAVVGVFVAAWGWGRGAGGRSLEGIELDVTSPGIREMR